MELKVTVQASPHRKDRLAAIDVRCPGDERCFALLFRLRCLDCLLCSRLLLEFAHPSSVCQRPSPLDRKGAWHWARYWTPNSACYWVFLLADDLDSAWDGQSAVHSEYQQALHLGLQWDFHLVLMLWELGLATDCRAKMLMDWQRDSRLESLKSVV